MPERIDFVVLPFERRAVHDPRIDKFLERQVENRGVVTDGSRVAGHLAAQLDDVATIAVQLAVAVLKRRADLYTR